MGDLSEKLIGNIYATIAFLLISFLAAISLIETFSDMLGSIPIINNSLLRGIVAAVSGYMTLLSYSIQRYNDLYSKVTNLISTIKGIDENKEETDVIRKLLEIQVGKVANLILPENKSFPLCLVPGGDIALIMNQTEYTSILEKLNKESSNLGLKVQWTTAVPFESLNKGLAYSGLHWQTRMKDGPSKVFCRDGNEKFYSYISQWNMLKNGEQIIVLDNPDIDPYHPLSWNKYKHKNIDDKNSEEKGFNLDINKYLFVRYESDGTDTRKNLLSANESYFESETIRKKVSEAGRGKNNVRWISLDEIRQIAKDLLKIDPNKIYNIDFVCYTGAGCKFCLVRVDPSNYLEYNIVGVTLIIINSEILNNYYNLFDKMWNVAKNTFKDLTNSEL